MLPALAPFCTQNSAVYIKYIVDYDDNAAGGGCVQFGFFVFEIVFIIRFKM